MVILFAGHSMNAMSDGEMLPTNPNEGVGAVKRLYTFNELSVSESTHALAEGGCYWLLNVVRTVRSKFDEAAFIVVTAVARSNRSASIVAFSDVSELVYEHKLTWTDLPRKSVTLYVAGGVVMLPEEFDEAPTGS